MKHLLKTSVIFSSLIFTACGGGSSNNDDSEPDNPAPVTGNAAPEITLGSNTVDITVGESAILDASGTTDADGDTLTFTWSGDATIESPSESVTSVTGLSVGSYIFTVTVSDGTNEVSDTVDVNVSGPTVVETTNLATGTIAAPEFAYYDLETASELVLTEEEAATNAEWDIAFKRTDVYLNSTAATPVTLYFLDNVDEFYGEDNAVVVERFINATAETELAAFESISTDISDDAIFNTDEVENAISDFYIYNPINHTTSANTEAYFIVSSDDALTKFNVTELVQDGFGLSSITFNTAYQADGESVFAESETLAVDATTCTEDLYIDFDSNTLVSDQDGWDIHMPCADGLANYEINLADDAMALSVDYGDLDGINDANFPFYPWTENESEALAIVAHGDDRSNYGWGEYGVNGGHVIWPNFATYIIQTASGQYKFQITSYYDTDTGASGSYSIRHQLIINE